MREILEAANFASLMSPTSWWPVQQHARQQHQQLPSPRLTSWVTDIDPTTHLIQSCLQHTPKWPFKKTGTVFITQALLLNSDPRSSTSMDWNASRIAIGSWTSNSSVGISVSSSPLTTEPSSKLGSVSVSASSLSRLNSLTTSASPFGPPTKTNRLRRRSTGMADSPISSLGVSMANSTSDSR